MKVYKANVELKMHKIEFSEVKLDGLSLSNSLDRYYSIFQGINLLGEHEILISYGKIGKKSREKR